MKYKNSVNSEHTQRTITPPPPPHRNTRNYLLLICLSLCLTLLFAGCPLNYQPDEDTENINLLTSSNLTNIRVSGDFHPEYGKTTPLRLDYTDGSSDFAYLDYLGSVFLENGQTANSRGKTFYRLYLTNEETSILLGRKFDENPIHLRIDALGSLHFRQPRENPADGGALYIPIGTVEEFIRIGLNDETRNGSYLLMGELDMLGSSAMSAPRLNWTPIGMNDVGDPPADKFTGRFDGGGEKISNLYIDKSDGDYYNIGLFGYIAGAVLKNIVIASGSVQGYENVGGIAGCAEGNSEISGCSNAAAVTTNSYHAGGVVGNLGYSGAGSVTACSNTGDVMGELLAGGIAGYGGSATVTACYNTGAVTAYYSVGGVVGTAHTITACYNTGAVRGGSYVGGVAGQTTDSAAITACYNTGAVTANNEKVGGIAGFTGGGSNITACYNTGAVTSITDTAYGVVGFVNWPGTVTACYWLYLPGDNAAELGKNAVPPPSNDNAEPFAGDAWPSFDTDWSAYKWTQSGDEITPGKYWKSLGLWSESPTDGSKSEFPKLYWQQ
jgi:hypothetical protein